MFDWVIQHYFQILQCVGFAFVMTELTVIRGQLSKANRVLGRMQGSGHAEKNIPVGFAANQDR